MAHTRRRRHAPDSSCRRTGCRSMIESTPFRGLGARPPEVGVGVQHELFDPLPEDRVVGPHQDLHREVGKVCRQPGLEDQVQPRPSRRSWRGDQPLREGVPFPQIEGGGGGRRLRPAPTGPAQKRASQQNSATQRPPGTRERFQDVTRCEEVPVVASIDPARARNPWSPDRFEAGRGRQPGWPRWACGRHPDGGSFPRSTVLLSARHC